jgi:hypothetical protein
MNSVKTKISQLHFNYGYSSDQTPITRIKCILNAVRSDGLEPVYVFFQKWRDIPYKQKDFEKLKLLYPKREHEIMANLEKEQLQILLEELNIEEEDYMENALKEILKMMPIYGAKRGYALMQLMTEEEIEISETKEKSEKSEKSENDNSVNFYYAVMIMAFIMFVMFVIYGSLLVYYVKFKLSNIEDKLEAYNKNLL